MITEDAASSQQAWDTFKTPQQESERKTDAEAVKEQWVSEETTALAALLQQEARHRRNENLTVFLWAGIFIAAMLTASNLPESLATIKVAFLFMMTMGAGMIAQLLRRSYRRKQTFTRSLTQVQSIEQVGLLVQTLQVENTSVRNLAKQTLIKLLPNLQANHAALLGEYERKILLRQLAISPNEIGHRDITELFSRTAYRREVDLRVAILKAYEQVGGAKELLTVERLARGLPTLPSTSKFPTEVCEAARECLPFLQSRVSEQRASEQLLRPSSIQNTSTDLLLRPAVSERDALPEQLLRAAGQ